VTDRRGEPIFRSTGQAVHFAFVIEACDAAIDSPMGIALRRIMKAMGVWDSGTPPSIDFGNLSPMEVRGQCAMIRAAVHDRLPDLERWAVQARYGIRVARRDGDPPVFSRDRWAAIRSIGAALAPALDVEAQAATLLVARAIDARTCHITVRRMVEDFGRSAMFWSRAARTVRDRLYALENSAFDRLEPSFIADGLVEPRQ
jgi:hypothetical protein